MWSPYFVNLNNNTFQLKTLLFFVHLHSQQKRTKKSHRQLSNLQCLRVAIISRLIYSKCLPSVSTQADIRRLQSSMAWFTTSTTGCSFNRPRCLQSLQKVLHTTLAPLRVANSVRRKYGTSLPFPSAFPPSLLTLSFPSPSFPSPLPL